VARSMNRVADKLLHAPTVRVKELAGSPAADSYEDALRVLFDLDPAVVQAVAQADPLLAPPPAGPARAAQPAAQGKVRQAAGEGRTAGDGDANAGEGR